MRPRPASCPTPRRAASPSAQRLAGLLLALAALLGAPAARGQIVREKPAQVKAANRRALREAQGTDSPYKDSHLAVTPGRLRRGESSQPPPEGSDRLHYKNGTAPNVKPPGFFGLRRPKKGGRPHRPGADEKK